MAVSRGDVVSAYRFLLNREPEAGANLAMFQAADDWRALRQWFCDSEEYKALHQHEPARDLEVGRFLGAPALNVETVASSAEMDAMFQRIYKSWRMMGDVEPHWSVLTNDVFKKASFETHREGFFNGDYVVYKPASFTG